MSAKQRWTTNGNTYIDKVIVLFSDMNPGFEAYIIPEKGHQLEEIQKVASEAYAEWFAADEVSNPTAYYDAYGSYIIYKLKEAGYEEKEDYLIFFGEKEDEE